MSKQLYPISRCGDTSNKHSGKAGNKGTNAKHNSSSGANSEASQIEHDADEQYAAGKISKSQWKKLQRKANAKRTRAADSLSGGTTFGDLLGI